jgi:hypothetical protein
MTLHVGKNGFTRDQTLQRQRRSRYEAGAFLQARRGWRNRPAAKQNDGPGLVTTLRASARYDISTWRMVVLATHTPLTRVLPAYAYPRRLALYARQIVGQSAEQIVLALIVPLGLMQRSPALSRD